MKQYILLRSGERHDRSRTAIARTQDAAFFGSRGKRLRTKSKLVPALYVVIFFIAAAGCAYASGTAKNEFLADHHQDSGVACNGCHKTTPPKDDVESSACVGCHGGLAEVSKRTANLARNPHDCPHMGEVPCESCHHGHKPSENTCLQCHPPEQASN